MDGEHGEQIAALERLDKALDQPRNAVRVEAPRHITRAYQRLIVAVGFGHLGAVDRAQAEVAAAMKTLASSDPVHALAIEAFRARVDDACAGRSRLAPLPSAVIERRANLDRVSAYKAGRLWEASRILAPGVGREDPMSHFARRERAPVARPAIQHGVTGGQLVAQIASELAAGALEHADRGFACLERMLEIPEDTGMPLLVEVMAKVEAMRDPPIALRVAALQVIARHGWGELVTPLIEPLTRLLAELTTADLVEPLGHTLRALRRLDLVDQLARVIAPLRGRLADLPRRPTVTPDAPLAVRYLIQGAEAFLGERPDLEPTGLGQANLTDQLEWHRCVANGHALGRVPAAIAGLESLQPAYRNVTDALGTNSHFCLAVLDFTDTLVVALIQSRMGRGTP